jgi:orotate phosphoribosyltransferase
MERLSDADVEALLAGAGVLLAGHFALSSGAHSDTYLQCARALSDPGLALALGRELAERVRARGVQVDVVASPALGGVLAGFVTAAALERRFVFAERVEGAFTFRRGQRVAPGESVVVVEDVVTTGGSAAEVLALVAAAGAVPAGVASIVDRSAGLPAARRPPWTPVSLHRAAPQVWEPADCPRCAEGLPLDRPGSRSLNAR